MSRRLPVTLVGGFFGAGKTSLLHHLIAEHAGGHLAVLVENPGPLNIDAKALRGLCGAMRRLYDTVLEIPDVDEAAQAGWLADQLRELASAGRYEHVLVEFGGATNAARWVQHFGSDNAGLFAEWAELAQVVCVVDALDLIRTNRKPGANPLWEFQCAQIAGASLLVLNKCDLVDDAERQTATRLLRGMNSQARIIETDYGEVPAEAWKKPSRPFAVVSETKADPATPVLGSVLYRAYRPLHPARFWDWFQAEHPGLLRVKGVIWLATRNLLVGGVSRTSWENACGPAGIWWAALPREEWPEETEALRRMQETWREPYGDRRQELVLIGDPAHLSAATRQLEACLLNAEEYARPVAEWISFPDPFPDWDLEGE